MQLKSIIGLIIGILGGTLIHPLVLADNTTTVDMYAEENTALSNIIITLDNTKFPQNKWWLQFNDPLLNHYIEKALTHNYDIKIAQGTIAELQQLTNKIRSLESPVVDLSSGYTRQRNSATLLTPKTRDLAQSGVKLFSPGSSFNIFSLPLTTSYEVDFLQKNRRFTKAKKELVQAAMYDSQVIKIMISAQVASTYFNLIRTDHFADLQKQLIQLYEDKCTITKSLLDAGLVDITEVESTKWQLAQVKKHYIETVDQQKLFVNTLTTLMGEPPLLEEHFKRSTLESITQIKTIPVGTPPELVFKRPDILAEETRLKSLKLDIEGYKRALFPAITFNGTFGFATTTLSKLFNWESYLASIAPSIGYDIFSGGSKKASLHLAKALYEKQLNHYHKTILISFQEVEDSIIRLNTAYNNLRQSTKQFVNNSKIFQTNNTLYQSGLLGYLEYLPAQESLLQSKMDVADHKIDILINVISLYKSLGSGS